MDIWENRQGTVVILTVHGKLDDATSPLFEEKVLPMLEEGQKNFLIDFAHLEYISSAALRCLLVLGKNANTAGGKVVIVSPQGHIREIFGIAGFAHIFPIYASPEEAMRSF